MSPTAQKGVGISGVVSILGGTIPYLFVPSAPGSGSSVAQIVSFYSEHGGVLFATWLGGAVPLVLSIVFLAGLVALMRQVEGDGGWIWLALLMSAVGIVTAAMAQAVLGAVLPLAASSDTSIAVVVLRLLALSYGSQFVFLVPFLGLIGWITSTRHGLPAWLGYVAYAAAVVGAIGTFGIFVQPGPGEALSYLAFVVGGLWWLLTSIVLIVRPIGSGTAHTASS